MQLIGKQNEMLELQNGKMNLRVYLGTYVCMCIFVNYIALSMGLMLVSN